jgi:hypothetical protein
MRGDRFMPVVAVLVDYLVASPTAVIPGADGLLVGDVVACYPTAAAFGHVPAENEKCHRHPEFAGRLAAFFYLTRDPVVKLTPPVVGAGNRVGRSPESCRAIPPARQPMTRLAAGGGA